MRRPETRRSIATVALSGSLETKLVAAAAARFDGIELFENDLIGSLLSPGEVRRRVEELGLEIFMYQPFRDFEAVTTDAFARNLERAERKFDVMEQLGTRLLLVCSNVAPHAIDDDGLAAAQLHELAERAGARGFTIAYEALAWGTHVFDYEHAWRIVERADHASLGVCLDSFHIVSRETDLSGIERIPGEKIAFLQLADAPQLVMDVLQWSRHYRCFPGQGGFDVAAFVSKVVRAGYAGPLSLEVFNDVFRQADAERIASDAMRSLLALEEQVPELASELPPGAPLHGYPFVRLESADAAVGILLERLGFARAGTHVSRDAEMWQQGAIRLVLDHDEGAYDARIAAIGLESDDPSQSVARADALLARPRADDAEYEVRAPDDVALCLCASTEAGPWSWLDRFDLAELEPAETGLLTRIDHVALSQPFDYFDEAMLFYRSVLGLELQASQELAAPYGLVRSRAVRSADGSVRIALNVPLLGREVGPGAQHIAFACDDILDAATALAERGVGPLPISDNYYDDLRARLDLDAERLESLRAANVLYDRGEKGEFFHFYTPMLGSRLFFEVVQRVGDYDGYGAANAPVRMAAQFEAPQALVR